MVNKNAQSNFVNVAQVFADIRKEQKLFTVTEAAASCGLTENTIRNFENGKTINGTLLLFYARAIIEFDNTIKGWVLSQLLEAAPELVKGGMKYGH